MTRPRARNETGMFVRASSRDSGSTPPLAAIGFTTSLTPSGREMAVAIWPGRTLPPFPMPRRYVARTLSGPVITREPSRPSPNVTKTVPSSAISVTKMWSRGIAPRRVSCSCQRTSLTRTARVEVTPSCVAAATYVRGL